MEIGQKAALMKWRDGMTWRQVEDELGMPRAKFRSQARRYRDGHQDEFETEPPVIDGVRASDLQPDPERAFERLQQDFENLRLLDDIRRRQRLTFKQDVIALAWSADWHVGAQGTNYKRLRSDLELIRDTPGMYLVLGGDLIDNFIIGKLRQVRNDARASIPDEWAVIRMLLQIAAEKTVITVEGNHDRWTKLLCGVDYFADVMRDILGTALYDPFEVRTHIDVGGWKDIILCARHKWRGCSQYSSTHAIEKSEKFGPSFHIGMGAHTHPMGQVRQFEAHINERTVTGLSLMCGSYKELDPYPRQMGMPESGNESATVVAVIDSRNHALFGLNNLECAARWMEDV